MILKPFTYRQEKINTNADALSRIEINSEILRELIPKAEVKAITRQMAKKLDEQNK